MEIIVNQRIKKIIEYYKISDRKFSQIINISSSTLSNYFKRGSEPSVGIIQNILSSFEEISPDWLLLGKGEMLRSNPAEAKDPPDNREVITLLLERIEKLSGEVALLKKELEKREEK